MTSGPPSSSNTTTTGSDFYAALPRKRMGAGILFTDPGGRVLLVEPAYKPDWEIPGGTVEEGESPRLAAQREVTEELGLTVRAGRLLVTDWVPPHGDRTDGLMLIFDGGTLTSTSAVTLPAAELRSWAWCTGAEAHDRLIPLLARRVTAALRARDDGSSLYLEDGRLIG
ncbi:MAG TPA: NUDIX hydrolase [Actinoplanes sp.]|nr:NUDIX hydrolase [Actinoplanes sp.]